MNIPLFNDRIEQGNFNSVLEILTLYYDFGRASPKYSFYIHHDEKTRHLLICQKQNAFRILVLLMN